MKKMKPIIFTGFLSFCLLSCFTQDLKTMNDLVYGKANNWKGSPEDLKLDIYFSRQDKALPLIIFFHGGGFTGGEKKGHSNFCRRLASNGYVVANVNYRTGFDTSKGFFGPGVIEASYRANQDADAAIRYMIFHAPEYHIDTSAIFLAGESAGAVTILAHTYLTQATWDAAFPTIHPHSGTVEGQGNDLKATYSVKGVISLWGGVYDTTLLNPAQSRNVPLLLIQSQDDETIPYEHAKGQKAIFNAIYGSFDIAERVRNGGGCAQLYFVTGARHFFGFSHQYVINAINIFIDDVQHGHYYSFTVENRKEKKDVPFSVYVE
jgi:acetyl esterase/lipase